jgi:hypothetical protein
MIANAISTAMTFEESTHAYKVGDRKLTSVTTILRETHLYPDYATVTDPKYRHLGSAVHSACHLYDLGLLDEDSLHPDVAGRLAQYKRFLEDTGFVPRVWELPLCDPARDVAGMFDILGKAGDDEIWLLDTKTGTVPVVGVAVQLAGYFDLIANGGRVMQKTVPEDPRMPPVDFGWFETARRQPKRIRRKSLGLTLENYTLRSHDEPKWSRYWNAAVTLHAAWKENGL